MEQASLSIYPSLSQWIDQNTAQSLFSISVFWRANWRHFQPSVRERSLRVLLQMETRCNIGSAGRNIRACQWKDGPSLAHSRGDADDQNNYITYNKLSCDTVPLQTGWIAREEAFMARWLQITPGECTYRTIDGKPIATLLDFITLYLLTDVYEVYTVVSELNKILLEKIRASDHFDHTLRCYYNAYILVGHLDWMVLY